MNNIGDPSWKLTGPPFEEHDTRCPCHEDNDGAHATIDADCICAALAQEDTDFLYDLWRDGQIEERYS